MSDYRILQGGNNKASSLKDPPNIFRWTSSNAKEKSTAKTCVDDAKSDNTELTNNRTSPAAKSLINRSHPQKPLVDSHRLVLLQTSAEQEAKNKTIETENLRIHKKLIALAKGRDKKALEEDIELARQRFERQRLQEKERKNQEIANDNAALQQRLWQIKNGRDSKSLDATTKQRRFELQKQRHLAAETRRLELTRQNEELKHRLEHVHDPERFFGRDEAKQEQWIQKQVALAEKQQAFETMRRAEKSRQHKDRQKHEQELSNLVSSVSQGRDVKSLNDPEDENYERNGK